jgi:hypothetical protein
MPEDGTRTPPKACNPPGGGVFVGTDCDSLNRFMKAETAMVYRGDGTTESRDRKLFLSGMPLQVLCTSGATKAKRKGSAHW